MAKARKSDDAKSEKSDKSKAAAEAAAKKPAPKPKATVGAAKAGGGGAKAGGKPARTGPGGTTATPMIDTNLAAQAAAKMLTAGVQGRNAAVGAGGKPQSAMFKQL